MNQPAKSGAFVLLLLVAFGCVSARVFHSRPSTETAMFSPDSLQDLIASRHYAFRAESVLPQQGRIRILTLDYELKIENDTLVCDLPYYGKEYTAPVDPSQDPMEFKSFNFGYSFKTGKKGNWEVYLTPRDGSAVSQMDMDI